MDLYKRTMDYLSGLSTVCAWPEVLTLLERAATREPYGWRLPVIACNAVGGSVDQAIPAAAAAACLQMSIIHVDDMLDADPRGLYHELGMPAVANLSVAFQAAGLEAISKSDTRRSVKLAAVRALNLMTLTTAYGQYLDGRRVVDEAAYWHLVRTKSSPFFAATMQAGALLGEASAETVMHVNQFGLIYGEIIQIHDDMSDAMARPANPDWLLGRSPLPILYAQIVEHADRERFMTLRAAASDPEALAEAQSILVRCGAVSYCIDQVRCRYRQLQWLLTTMPLKEVEELESLLDSVQGPMRTLFNTAGIEARTTMFDELQP